ncbi:MAG: hypothetical protein ACTHOP_06465 [Mesorhizobium sp.]
MTEPTRATVRQRLYAFLIAGLGGLAASAVSFSMAVYEAAHPPETPAVAAGQQIDTGRWFVTLRSARIGTISPTGVPPSNPKQLIMVDLDVVNRSAMPNNLLGKVVVSAPLAAPTGAVPEIPTTYLDRDKYFANYFNPNMPERVTMAWTWPQGMPAPETLTVIVKGEIYKLRDNLYGATGWYDGDPVATVELPVERVP